MRGRAGVGGNAKKPHRQYGGKNKKGRSPKAAALLFSDAEGRNRTAGTGIFRTVLPVFLTPSNCTNYLRALQISDSVFCRIRYKFFRTLGNEV
jgi:hypothetical protein